MAVKSLTAETCKKGEKVVTNKRNKIKKKTKHPQTSEGVFS